MCSENEQEELFVGFADGFLLYETRFALDVKAQINGLWRLCDMCELQEVLNRNNLDPFDWRIPTNPLEDDL